MEKENGRREREGKKVLHHSETIIIAEGKCTSAYLVHWCEGEGGEITLDDFMASFVMDAILARETGGFTSSREFN